MASAIKTSPHELHPFAAPKKDWDGRPKWTSMRPSGSPSISTSKAANPSLSPSKLSPSSRRLALKVDCDTFEGTKKGIPGLLDLFQEFGIKASFFFTLGPDTS